MILRFFFFYIGIWNIIFLFISFSFFFFFWISVCNKYLNEPVCCEHDWSMMVVQLEAIKRKSINLSRAYKWCKRFENSQFVLGRAVLGHRGRNNLGLFLSLSLSLPHTRSRVTAGKILSRGAASARLPIETWVHSRPVCRYWALTFRLSILFFFRGRGGGGRHPHSCQEAVTVGLLLQAWGHSSMCIGYTCVCTGPNCLARAWCFNMP